MNNYNTSLLNTHLHMCVNRQLWSVPKKVSVKLTWFFTIISGEKKQLVDLAFITHLSSVRIVFCSKKSQTFSVHGSFLMILPTFVEALIRSWTVQQFWRFVKIITLMKTEYFGYPLPLCLCALWLCTYNNTKLTFNSMWSLNQRTPSGPAVIYRAKAPSSKLHQCSYIILCRET